MNKKKLLMFGIVGFFAVALVTAGLLQYYGKINQEVSVEQAVILEGCEGNICVENVVNGWTGDAFLSNVYTLKNLADTTREVMLTTAYPTEDEGEIETTYLEIVTPSADEEGDVDLVTPSTNVNNSGLGWAHFNKLDVNANSIELEFVSTRTFQSCFEYRIDGDTSAASGSNYNGDITDGLYPFFCEDDSTRIETLNANEFIEIRMVFGGEADERFNWTKIYVSGSPLTLPTTLDAVSSIDFVIVNKINDLSDGVDGTITTEVIPA